MLKCACTKLALSSQGTFTISLVVYCSRNIKMYRLALQSQTAPRSSPNLLAFCRVLWFSSCFRA